MRDPWLTAQPALAKCTCTSSSATPHVRPTPTPTPLQVNPTSAWTSPLQPSTFLSPSAPLCWSSWSASATPALNEALPQTPNVETSTCSPTPHPYWHSCSYLPYLSWWPLLLPLHPEVWVLLAYCCGFSVMFYLASTTAKSFGKMKLSLQSLIRWLRRLNAFIMPPLVSLS